MDKAGTVLRAGALWGMALAATAFADGSGNRLGNGDFSRGLAEWTVRFPEPNETKYARNHLWVDTVENPLGEGVVARFSLNRSVAASEGVKASTPLLPVEPGVAYEFGADILSEEPTAKVILEGYVEDAERTARGADQIPGFRRIYRAVIHPKGVSGSVWTSHRRRIAPPSRHQPTHVLVKLYAYWPEGKIFYDNVFLREAE